MFVNTRGHIDTDSKIAYMGLSNSMWFKDGGVKLSLNGTNLLLKCDGWIQVGDDFYILTTKMLGNILFLAYHKEGHLIAGTTGDIKSLRLFLNSIPLDIFPEYNEWYNNFCKSETYHRLA